MKKMLLPTLLIIIFGLASITPFGTTLSTEQHNLTSSNYDRTYTLDVEHGNHRSTYTLYVSVPPSLYDYYRGETHYANGEREYAKFVTPNAVKTIAENIRNMTSNRPNSDEEFANDVLTFVRQIPYTVSAFKYPIEAIVDNSGDCDVLSYLAASIMKAGGLDVVLVVYRGLSTSHMNVGVYLPHNPLYATSKTGPFGLEHNNKTYWVAECTPSGNWKVGELPEFFAYLNTTIISLEKQEEPSPAYISSSLNNPLRHSVISITLSLEKTTAGKKEWPLTISGSISPKYSGKNVLLYVSQDGSSYKTFQTVTENLGNYSLTWNVTSPGTYRIRTSFIGFSSYAGSDSETITVFVGSYPQWIGGNEPDDVLAPADITGYKVFSGRGFNEFLKHDLAGKNVSLSGEFIILNSGQTTANSDYTITIPESEQRIILSRRRTWIIKMPEQTMTIQESEQASNQLGFILQNNDGNYSASVKLLDDSDLSNIEKQLSGNNATFMNATTSIKENVWYKAVARISNGEISTELHGENGTILKSTATKDDVLSIDESGIFISFEPYSFIAFKNLKVENLDQPPNDTVGDIQFPVNGLESLAPYVMLLTLLVIVGATITYLRKRVKKPKNTSLQLRRFFAFNLQAE
jgi:hypothetical protein